MAAKLLRDNLNNDHELLVRVSEGDQIAFQELVNRYSSKVFFHAMTFVKTWHQAEEITQDIFLHIWQKKEKLPQVDSLSNYIYVVSKNFLISYIRKKVRQFDPAEFANGADLTECSASKYENKELGLLIEKAIGHLPQQKQQIFRMIHQDGMGQDEVAQKLGIATRTVRWNLVSAINGIRNFLHWHSPGDTLFVFFLLFENFLKIIAF